MTLLKIDSLNKEPNPTPKDISIDFVYDEKSYEEIRYNKMMGFESWISNVGGFVGIFLGYSMLQIPEFIASMIAFFHHQKFKMIYGNLMLRNLRSYDIMDANMTVMKEFEKLFLVFRILAKVCSETSKS